MSQPLSYTLSLPEQNCSQRSLHVYSYSVSVTSYSQRRRFLSNTGSATYWLRARSPNAAFNCLACSLAPGSSSPVATEPLQIAFDGSVASSVVSDQVQPPPHVPACMRSFSGSICPHLMPSPASPLRRLDRVAMPVVSGHVTFTTLEDRLVGFMVKRHALRL